MNFFLMGLSLILIHEMDAIRCKEWRIFPLLSKLDDKTGQMVFILAHIPLYYFCFNELNQNNESPLIHFLDYFFIIHLGLHILFLKHPKNAFKDWLSWFLIIGTAICGCLDLIIK